MRAIAHPATRLRHTNCSGQILTTPSRLPSGRRTFPTLGDLHPLLGLLARGWAQPAAHGLGRGDVPEIHGRPRVHTGGTLPPQRSGKGS